MKKKMSVLYKDMLNQRMLPVVDMDITHESARDWIHQLLIFEKESHDPITILIDTDGGSRNAADLMGDVIRALHSPVDGLVINRGISSGFALLQHCRRRLAFPSAYFILHWGTNRYVYSIDPNFNVASALTQINADKAEVARYIEHVSARSKLTTKELISVYDFGQLHERIYSAQEMLDMGLIDKIVTDFKFFPEK